MRVRVYYVSNHTVDYDMDTTAFTTMEMTDAATVRDALEAGKTVIILDNVCAIRRLKEKAEEEEDDA